MRRRKEATERVRSSPSLAVALVTVRRPRSFAAPPRLGLTAGTASFGGVMMRRVGVAGVAVVVVAVPAFGGRRRGGLRRRSRGPRRVEHDLLRPARIPGNGSQGHAGVGFGGGRAGRRETAARLILGPTLGLGFARKTGLLFLLAGFRRLRVRRARAPRAQPDAGLRLLALAVFLLTHAGVAEGAGAGVALVGQGAQHDAGLRTRRGRLHRRTRRRGRGRLRRGGLCR